MSLDYLNEAFKKLEMISLNEETFNTSFTGLNDLAAFMDDDDTSDLVKVIDPDATTPEKLEDSYVGKVITRCNVCHSNIFNNKEEIVIDDDGDVNPESQCPYCGEFSGFTILGEICPFEANTSEEPEETKEVEAPEVEEVEEDETVELEESLESCAPTSIESYLDDVEDGEGWVTVDKAVSDLEMLGCTTTEEEFKNFLADYKRAYILTFGDIDVVFTPTAPSYDTVGKELGIEESDLTEAVAKSIAEDSHEADTEKIYTLSCTGPDLHDAITLGKVPMYLKNVKEVELIDWDRVPVKKYNQICRFLHDLGIKVTKGASGREPTEAVALKENRSDFKPHTQRLLKLIGSNLLNDTDILEEDFKEVSIKTEDQHLEMTSDENGKVTVVSEPLNSDEGEIEATTDEMITPISDETISEIEAQNAPEEEDAVAEEGSEEEPTAEEDEELDFEDVDEDALDELGEAYLRKVYENVESFKTTNVALTPKNFIVEGLIKFTSGTEKKTGFVFNEAQNIQDTANIKFLGENLQLSRGKRAFGLSGKIIDKKFFAESLSYNYRTSNVKDSADRVSGVVTRK